MGEPAVKVGDKYVLFIEGKEKKDYTEGEIYYSSSSFMFKYIICDDGRYRRYSTLVDPLDYVDEAGRNVPEEPMTIDEIKEKIAVQFGYGQVKEAVKDSSTLSDKYEKGETLIQATKIDLYNDGADEIIEIVTDKKIDVNKESVEDYLEDGGVLWFQIRNLDGTLLEETKSMLYSEPYGNGQYYLIEREGKQFILYTKTSENYWMGMISYELRELKDSRFSAVSYNSVTYSKMIRNPLDDKDTLRENAVLTIKDELNELLEDATIIVAVDSLHEPAVLYSTDDEIISANEYFHEVWER